MINNFIKTQDENTALELRKTLKELPKEGSFFVFINESGKLDFAEDKTLVYTNKLSI